MLKRLINSTELSFLADVIQVVTFIFSLFALSGNLSIDLSNTIFVLIVLVLVLALVISLLRVIEKALLITRSVEHTHTINKSTNSYTKTGYIHDFEKIVPTTSHIKQLTKEVIKRAKLWSRDADTAETKLSISIRQSLEIDYKIEVQSPSKKLTTWYYLRDLKLPDNTLPSVDKLSRLRFDWTHYKPFTANKYWRKGIIDAYKSVESELIGKEFSCDIINEYPNGDCYISIYIKETLNRFITFKLTDKELINKETGEVVRVYR